ncbi:MAG: hypothetical protein QXF17_01345 [Ignisphaera sp.]
MNTENIITEERRYTPATIYTPQQVVGVQQLDLSAIMNLMLIMVVVFMMFGLIGKLTKSVG